MGCAESSNANPPVSHQLQTRPEKPSLDNNSNQAKGLPASHPTVQAQPPSSTPLIYHCHLQRTAEQIEDDSANGIVERLTRTLTLDPAGKKISFEFNYYYEVEGPGYVLEICFKNDTKFQGTYEQQGDKIVVTITGGSQNATDNVAKQTIFSTDQVTGHAQFLQDGTGLKVVMVALKPEDMDRRESILKANQVFKKK